MKPMCNCTWAFFSKNDAQFFPSFFSLFWRENFLVGLGRKYLSPNIYFPSSPPNQTYSKKVFFLIFTSQFSIHYISPSNKYTLRVHLIGRVEKWEDGKIGEQKKFYFLSYLFGWEWKSEGMKKMGLNKFTHIPLLKNDAQLK